MAAKQLDLFLDYAPQIIRGKGYSAQFAFELACRDLNLDSRADCDEVLEVRHLIGRMWNS